ncbi:MAG: iron ABC transporter permease, partial [Clostridia bacterium]
LFGLEMNAGPLNIYSLGGLVWVLTTFYYPYAFITISRAMEKMDPSLEEASRIAGASPLKTLRTITLPMMMPSIVAGALLVYVCAASCYGIPSIIGAPGKVHTVTTRIIEYYGMGTDGINDATGLAVFLMVMAIIILYISDFVVARKQYITVSGKSTRPNIVDLRKWRIPMTALVSLFAGLIIMVPFLTILATSFKKNLGKGLFDAGNFTINHWTKIFSRADILESLGHSIVYGAITATIGVLIACTMAYLLQRTRVRGRRIPDFLITLGSGTPSVVIALSLIMTMNGRFGISLYNTAYIMIIAYLIKYLMMGMRTVVSAMSQIHVSLEESSQISGASWLRTMRCITMRLIWPSIAAGWFLIFIPSFYELSMSALLYSSNTKVIGFQLYEYWTYTSQQQASAMAFGILLVVVALNFVLNKLTKGEFSI